MNLLRKAAALLVITLLAAACLGRPSAGPTPNPDDELSDFTEDQLPWKGSASVKLTGALRLDLAFTFVDTNSPLRGPGLVNLNFESEPYSLLLTGETGNPGSTANPMVLLLSNEEFDTISGKAPQCVFNFPQPGPSAIVGDVNCTGLVNGFSDAGGTVDLVAAIQIGPEG